MVRETVFWLCAGWRAVFDAGRAAGLRLPCLNIAETVPCGLLWIGGATSPPHVAAIASDAYLDSSVKAEGEGGGTLCSFRRWLLPPSAQSSNTAGAAELSRPAKPPQGSLGSSASSRSTLSFDGGSREDGVGEDRAGFSAVKVQRTRMRSAIG